MIRRGANRAARAEYERFFRLSSDLLCVAGFDGYFKLLNPAWERVLGYSIEELMEKPFLEFVHPDDREPVLAEAVKISEGDKTLSFDSRYRTKDGDYRWLHWSAVPSVKEQRVYAVARDITDRRLIADALERAKSSAEEANRAKSEFLATMSHELRTPLNAVIGFSDVLLSDAQSLDDTQRQYVERIRTNGTRLLGLIDRVLELEKIEAGRMDLDIEDIGLASLVKDLVSEFEPLAAESDVRLETEVPSHLRTIPTDYEGLRGVLANLLSNAIKFAPQGKVTVRVIARPRSREPAAIEVEDDGIGIAEDKLDLIFERFEQLEAGTSRRYGGSGLGLAIGRAQCTLLGFGLSVESSIGEGSTFRIDLGPQATSAESGERDSQAIALKIVGEIEAERRRTLFEDAVVLVIDADSDSRLVLTQMLQTVGCQVLAAGTGMRGLELAGSHSPALIVMDPYSTAVEGERLVEILAADRRLASIPVLAASSAPGVRGRAISGAAAVLQKPVDRVALERALARNLTPPVGRVLLVESNESHRLRFEACIAPLAAEWRYEQSHDAALSLLESYTPDLAVIQRDPERAGETLIAEIRRRPHLNEMAIVLTATEDLRTSELERIGRQSAPVIRKSAKLEANLRELCWELRRRAVS